MGRWADGQIEGRLKVGRDEEKADERQRRHVPS